MWLGLYNQFAQPKTATASAEVRPDHSTVGLRLHNLQETEDLELHAETVRKGVLAVLSGTAHATYFLLEQHTDTPRAQIVAQLMITYEWSDWRNGVVW